MSSFKLVNVILLSSFRSVSISLVHYSQRPSASAKTYIACVHFSLIRFGMGQDDKTPADLKNEQNLVPSTSEFTAPVHPRSGNSSGGNAGFTETGDEATECGGAPPVAAFRLERVPGRGVGAVAIRAIPRGELVIAETPAIRISGKEIADGTLREELAEQKYRRLKDEPKQRSGVADKYKMREDISSKAATTTSCAPTREDSDARSTYRVISAQQCENLEEYFPTEWSVAEKVWSMFDMHEEEHNCHGASSAARRNEDYGATITGALAAREHEPSGVKSAAGIFQSNAYSFDSGHAVFSNRDTGNAQWGLYPLTAKLNHSCRPNVAFSHDFKKDWVMRTFASRDIQAGEEICHCYSREICFQPRAARQKYFEEQFGFHCECEACTKGHAPSSPVGTRRTVASPPTTETNINPDSASIGQEPRCTSERRTTRQNPHPFKISDEQRARAKQVEQQLVFLANQNNSDDPRSPASSSSPGDDIKAPASTSRKKKNSNKFFPAFSPRVRNKGAAGAGGKQGDDPLTYLQTIEEYLSLLRAEGLDRPEHYLELGAIAFDITAVALQDLAQAEKWADCCAENACIMLGNDSDHAVVKKWQKKKQNLLLHARMI
ncbi:unnamed protein product [Amoebophrya sp. A120]|nr:unnamed protein product [Amoebophrya sp. A120]|eukprot:GSA120T00001585001.1